jgi:cytochrome c oxidase subunit 3/cytochrome o ubiquinol oxidase subunit 3
MPYDNTLTADELDIVTSWTLPDRGAIGMMMLILTESVLFMMFAAAYLFYLGKSTGGPSPHEILRVPIVSTICLLSSSITMAFAEHALRNSRVVRFRLWFLFTILLGLEFLTATGIEWRQFIYRDHFTISTNLFGTTFYSLVGLHASHVTLGLSLMIAALAAALLGFPLERQVRRITYLSWYWHFVDAVWVAVFSVVYVIGR